MTSSEQNEENNLNEAPRWFDERLYVEELNEANSLFDEKRYVEALSRYERLADKDHAYAGAMVGYMHHYGLGTTVDREKAAEWYSYVEPNSYLAQFQLGNLCKDKGDFQGMMDWYEKAASHGFLPAMFWLAYHFEVGNPATPIDREKAIELLRKAATLGHLPASMRLAQKQLRGEFGFWRRLGGLTLMIKTYMQVIRVGWTDPNSEWVSK
jgi:TPR repeat protein